PAGARRTGPRPAARPAADPRAGPWCSLKPGRSDRPLVVLPVGVAELPPVELPARVAGHVVGVVDRPGDLEPGQALAAVRQQLLGELGPGRGPGGRLDHRLDLLAPVLVRDAEDSRVGDLGVGEQLAFDLCRIDVDATGDDHVRLAVAQEEPALVVEVADVADGEEAG